MKMFSSLKTLALVGCMLLTSNAVMAGDGTRENPYTVAELNAQKEALQAAALTMLPFESNVKWVRADLKGLGEDGTLTNNADTEETVDGKTKTVHHLAGLFGDATGETFTAYSWQILGQLSMDDWTNTKDLLIALTWQQHSHSYANADNPWQGSDFEPDDFHFSLVEVYGALSLEIKDGYRGYHIPSCFAVPEGVCAVTVSAGYASSSGAYVKYRYYDGADEKTHVTLKNSAVVLMASDGIYDFVLTTDYYEAVMGTSNTLYGGTQAGENKGTKANRTRLRFVNDGMKVGFERNSTVILESKDEIYLEVSSANSNFGGKWNWETEDKDWISWNGGSYADQHASYALFDFTTPNLRGYMGENASDTKGWVYNETYSKYFISLQAVTGTSPNKNYYDNNRGNCFVIYKDGLLTVRAPKGNAVTKVEFTVAGNSNINKLTPSSGTVEGLTWTGNAEGVRFTQGATSYLATVAVTVAEKDENTVVLPGFDYVSCSNIAEFNALPDGSYARVQITDAQVIGKSADGVTTTWVQDATGGTALKYTSINDKLPEGKRVFGAFIVKKVSNQMREAEGTANSEALPQDLNQDLYTVKGTIDEINVPENLNRLVKIMGASFVATSATAGTLSLGDATIGVNNGNANAIDQLHKITDEWVKDETRMENVTILAILTAKNATTNQLLPISMVPMERFSLIFTTNANWEETYAYVWSGDGQDEVLGKWPGTKMYFNGRYSQFELSFDAEKAPEKIIFNDGVGGNEQRQTPDWDFEKEKIYQYYVENPLPKVVYTVAGAFNNGSGDAPIFGKTWDPTLQANDMVKDNGVYTLTLSNIELTTSGNILYKVVKNHEWTESWGFPEKENGNADYYVALPEGAEKATYNITFKFNPDAAFESGYQVGCDVELIDVTTAIRSITNNGIQITNGIYDLQGRRVSEFGIRNSELPKGLYIVDGKKVIVK